MRARHSHGVLLTDSVYRHVISLTLLLLILVPFHPLYAATESYDSGTNLGGTDRISPLFPGDQVNRAHQQVKLLIDTMRHDMPGLPAAIRSPSDWALNNIRAAEDEIGLTSDDVAGPKLFSFAHSLMPLSQPTENQTNAFWFSPIYRHHGFLPLHDAMVLGVGYRQSVLDDRVRLEARPYYGQNWLRPEGYWGSEFTISFAHGKIAPGVPQPAWGKIMFGFTNGDSQLMERQHGFDMHGELRFDDHLALHAGMRQNEDTTTGNYIMLRWKLLSD